MGQIPLFDELGHLIWTDREEFRHHVIPENIKADWDNAQNLYSFVVQLYKDGFLDEVEQGADRLLELSNREEEALLLKALVLMKKGENDQAQELLQECIDRFPERGVAHTYLARLYAHRSQREQVIAHLQEGLKKEPNQETSLRMLSEWMGDSEEVISFLSSLTEREEAWWPSLELGRLFLLEGRFEEALEQFSQAMIRTRAYREDPEGLPEWEEEVAAMTASALLRKEGCFSEMLRFCEQFWSPAYVTPFHGLDYAHTLDESGDTQKGVEVLSRMLEYVDPEYTNVVSMRIEQFKGKALSRS